MKIGGSTLGRHDTTLTDLAALQRAGREVVVVHGGGPVISQWMQRQGIPPQFVGGLRVTDAASLDIVVAVLAGLINKELASALQRLGAPAIGLSGVDGQMLQCRIANPALGYVGEIEAVDAAPLRALLAAGFIPLVAPVGVHRADGSENGGKPLNINGDTVAGELAYALGAERLVFLTDVAGVLDGGGRLIRRLDRRRARILFNSGVIQGGMIPKLNACLRALDAAPVADIVDGRQPEALLNCLRQAPTGTSITA